MGCLTGGLFYFNYVDLSWICTYVWSVTKRITIGAYYYPGWHSCPVRDATFKKNFSEWDLVYDCKARFDGQQQPNLPLWGRTNESSPRVFEKKIDAAIEYGVDLFVFAFYWSRGKRLLQGAIDDGFLGTPKNKDMRFALMWANRMPRKVLPVKKQATQLINPGRLVHTDPEDFLDFIKYLAPRYFALDNYYRIQGDLYLSIFDTNFFIRQLGEKLAGETFEKARQWLSDEGYGGLHLAAIDPVIQFQPQLKSIGFNSVTHYVHLPQWKGELLQDFSAAAKKRIDEWPGFSEASGLPYFPSVTPGWDANPRAVDFGKEKPSRYPWSPIITGRSPAGFEWFLRQAADFTCTNNPGTPLGLISSWNEWSEGHYLEPDQRYEYQWLEAVKNVKKNYSG
jgi:Glycosyltransferase WbsX